MKIDVTKLFDLSGKRAAVTGGGGALCGTMAEALGRLGVKVAVLDIDGKAAQLRQDSINAAGGTAKAIACNVLDEGELKSCYAQLCELWGGIDFLINGAGGNSPAGSTDREFLETEDLERDDLASFFNLPFDGFKRTFELNFFGTLLPSKILTRGMVERQSGAIVNVSSMSALAPLTKVGAYSAAKAAVANFTKWLAVHFSHVGVRVNAIAPGFFMTEQLRFLHIDKDSGEYTPRAKKAVAHTPMGRYGEPEELLGTVIWLLSEGSRFVTGNVVPIDGGYSSYTV